MCHNPHVCHQHTRPHHSLCGLTFEPRLKGQVLVLLHTTPLSVLYTQGADRPSPRAITLALLNQPYFKATSAFNSSYLLTALGQLVGEDGSCCEHSSR